MATTIPIISAIKLGTSFIIISYNDPLQQIKNNIQLNKHFIFGKICAKGIKCIGGNYYPSCRSAIVKYCAKDYHTGRQADAPGLIVSAKCKNHVSKRTQ